MSTPTPPRRFDPTGPTVPFDTGRWPFFYGWWLLGMCVLCILASAPGQTTGVSAFVDVLLAELPLDRAQLSTAYLVGTVFSACLLPYGGGLIDRYGSRRILLLACNLLAATCWALSGVDIASLHWASWLAIDPFWPAFVLLALGFGCLRFSGQGLMVLCNQAAIGHWFNRRRGTATAISGAVLAVCGNATPWALHHLVVGCGWREAWQVLALIIGPCFGLLAWIFWRDEPEPCGWRPDGARGGGAAAHAAERALARSGWSRGEAMFTRAFWTIAGCLAMLGLILTATTFHLADLGQRAGLSDEVANSFLIVIGLTAMPVGLTAGFLLDRIPPRVILATVIGMAALHLALMPAYGPGWRYLAPALALGCAAGCSGPVLGSMMPRYFGRAHLSAINGLQWALVVLASAIAPLSYALARDWTGRYLSAAWILIPVCLILFTSAVTLRPPASNRPTRASAAPD